MLLSTNGIKPSDIHYKFGCIPEPAMVSLIDTHLFPVVLNTISS